MKLKSYNNYGSDKEYVSVIFESDSGYQVTFGKSKKTGEWVDDEWTFESETVTFEEFEQAKKMLETILKAVKELEELK